MGQIFQHLHSVTRAWNGLSEKRKTPPSILAFRHKLNSDIQNPPQYYYYGNKLGQIHHTRIRLNCSSLKQHLFLINTIDGPLCECGAIEDTQHFLLNCNLFQNLRDDLLNIVTKYCQPTLNLLLYGNANLSEEEHKTIFFCRSRLNLKVKTFLIFLQTTFSITHLH